MEEKTEFGSRLDQLEASPEMEIYRNLQALNASYRVFNKNYSELIHSLEHFKSPKESLLMYAPEERENLEFIIDETSRLFHNFIASARLLVDHTRVTVNRLYSNLEFKEEYDEKSSRSL